jgi:hypothetical protein
MGVTIKTGERVEAVQQARSALKSLLLHTYKIIKLSLFAHLIINPF